MALPFQTFVNSVVEANGQGHINAATRTRLVYLTLAHWKFSGTELTIDDVAAEYEKKMTAAMRSFVAGVLGTIAGVMLADPKFRHELWDFSEIAHDIESNRQAYAPGRRIHYIHDGPRELPCIPDAVVD